MAAPPYHLVEEARAQAFRLGDSSRGGRLFRRERERESERASEREREREKEREKREKREREREKREKEREAGRSGGSRPGALDLKRGHEAPFLVSLRLRPGRRLPLSAGWQGLSLSLRARAFKITVRVGPS